jgi:hypothetical protein
MKQTAVQTLVEQLRFTHKEAYNDLYEVIQQALEMEKEQHDNTWLDSRTSYHEDDYIGKQQSFNEYYTETYGE